MNYENEIWKPIKGYEGLYDVSSIGRIKSLQRKGRPVDKIITPKPSGKYIQFGLRKNKKTNREYIHRLVAEAFIPCAFVKAQVNHIDGDKYNNNVSNLEWCTASENIQHAFRTGLACNKFRLKNVKRLSVDQAKSIIELIKKGFSVKSISSRYNISQSSVYNIKAKRQWKKLQA